MERDKYVFGKEEIMRRLQIPMERIDLLVKECGMPVADEDAFITWGTQNFARLWDEMEHYGPIARWEASVSVPVSASHAVGGS